MNLHRVISVARTETLNDLIKGVVNKSSVVKPRDTLNKASSVRQSNAQVKEIYGQV